MFSKTSPVCPQPFVCHRSRKRKEKIEMKEKPYIRSKCIHALKPAVRIRNVQEKKREIRWGCRYYERLRQRKENTRVDAANMSKRFGSVSATNNAVSRMPRRYRKSSPVSHQDGEFGGGERRKRSLFRAEMYGVTARVDGCAVAQIPSSMSSSS